MERQIDKKTCWECQQCGECCKGIILTRHESLSVVKEGKVVCRFLGEDKHCTNYDERPFICRLYPFVIDVRTIVDEKGTARPRKAFELENMKIHDDCPGFGKGKRVYANKNLQRKFEKLADQFAKDFKDVFEKKKEIKEMM